MCYGFTAHAQWTTVCNTGNGFVVDLASYGGQIYSTGFFTRDCNTNANYINKWDGTTWTAAGAGLDDAGHRICIIGTDMYVAKYKQAVDSNWVYKWDGSQFAKFGKSFYLTNAVVGFSKTPNIYDLVEYHGDIIASGEFDVADGKAISGIARWTGTTWDSLGAGLSGAIAGDVMYPHQMLVHNDTLYVVGNFLKAGGITVKGAAMWDGAQWHAMGAGFDHEVYAIAIYNGAIYAGGSFTKCGSTTLRHIARWDGNNWIDAGFSVYNNINTLYDDAFVHTLKQIGTRLFATGGFIKTLAPGDTQACNNIVAWDGAMVSTLSGGTHNYQIEGIMPYATNSILVSGGYNNDSSYVAVYDLHDLKVEPTGMQAPSIFPVPANDRLYIDGIKPGCQVAIYDMPGREVYHMTATAGSIDTDISALKAGAYMLRIWDEAGNQVVRMVIKQ